jgi:hypothetical protein
MSATDLLSHPAFQVWAAATVPFACRFAAAWTVWLRLRGLWSPVIGDAGARIPIGRSRSTADPIIAGLVWAAATGIGAVLVAPLWTALDQAGAALPIPALLLALSVVMSLLWLFLRIHADDVAWRTFRARAAAGQATDKPEAG